MATSPPPIQADQLSAGRDRDRRRRRRYSLNLDLEYAAAGSNSTTHTGKGRTIDISSNGILFQVEDCPDMGERIRLTLWWPARLNSGCSLRLVLDGVVVRRSANVYAMRFDRHEFRTAPVHTFTTQPTLPKQ